MNFPNFKKRKVLAALIIFLFAMVSCEKENEKQVKYLITDSASDYEVSFRNENGILINKSVSVESEEDNWSYEFTGKEGQILYVSAIYKNIESGIDVNILIDGKIYKEAQSLYDTLNYVIVSGTIPY
ncbi:MAG: hypothetical protein JEY97_10195 [Bacteroidales bacterium]|nr:hypothetical protein [Bacteroidales bacterium]